MRCPCRLPVVVYPLAPILIKLRCFPVRFPSSQTLIQRSPAPLLSTLYALVCCSYARGSTEFSFDCNCWTERGGIQECLLTHLDNVSKRSHSSDNGNTHFECAAVSTLKLTKRCFPDEVQVSRECARQMHIKRTNEESTVAPHCAWRAGATAASVCPHPNTDL